MSLIAVFVCVTIILLTLIIKYLHKFYSTVKTYPPGPVPIPVFGNLISLILRRDTNSFIAIHDMCHTHGKVSTFWFGTKPAIIVHDLDIAVNAFNQKNFAGKYSTPLELIMNGVSFKSFITQDFSISVQYHRKIAIEAIRQVLSAKTLCSLVKDIICDTVSIIKLRENNKPFFPESYFPKIIFRILTELTFGQKYSYDDKQLEMIRNAFETFNREIAKLMLIEVLPVSKFFVRNNKIIESKLNQLTSFYESSYESCKILSKLNRNCDTIIKSLLDTREKLLEKKKETSNYMTDSDIIGVISALFLAGNDTSMQTLNWLILIMAHYTEMQQKLRIEVNDQIGKNICPKLEDRKNCNYLNAFLHEVLRFRTITPIGVPHRTVNDTVLSNFLIPKDTMIMIDLFEILNDPQYWKDPELFIPERFLDSSGLFIEKRFTAFVPFGFGKRMCIGERMAVEMLFLELVCLLQATDGCQIELENGPQNGDLDVWSRATLTPEPKPYKIIFKQSEKL